MQDTTNKRDFPMLTEHSFQEDVGIHTLSCGQDPGPGIQMDYMFQSQVGLLIQSPCAGGKPQIYP